MELVSLFYGATEYLQQPKEFSFRKTQWVWLPKCVNVEG